MQRLAKSQRLKKSNRTARKSRILAVALLVNASPHIVYIFRIICLSYFLSSLHTVPHPVPHPVPVLEKPHHHHHHEFSHLHHHTNPHLAYANHLADYDHHKADQTSSGEQAQAQQIRSTIYPKKAALLQQQQLQQQQLQHQQQQQQQQLQQQQLQQQQEQQQQEQQQQQQQVSDLRFI